MAGLQAESLAAATCACSELKQAATAQHLWSRLYCQAFGVPDHLVGP